MFKSWHLFILLALLGFVAYAGAIFHPFVHDEVVFIVHNPYINDLNLKNIFYQTTLHDGKFPLVNHYYRPLLELFNRLQYRLWGMNPFGFHFANVLIHILNSTLIFACVFQLGRVFKIAEQIRRVQVFSFAIAVLFLLHPVQTEAVACISGISNLLSSFFGLIAFYCYLRIVNFSGGKRVGCYVLSLLAFALSLLVKEQMVILPIILILYEFCVFMQGKNDLRSRLNHILGFIFVCLLYFLLRKVLFGYPLTLVEDNQTEFFLRMAAIPRMILIHLGLVFFPVDLHYYRSIDILESPGFSGIILAIVFAVIAWIVFIARGGLRWFMVFALGFFAINLIPTLNIIPLVNEYSLLLLAEHFLYMPLMGMLCFLGGGLLLIPGKYFEQWNQRFVYGVAVVIVVFLMGMVMKQNTYWRSEVAMFERTVKYQPNFGRVRILLAKAYFNEGKIPLAIEQYHQGLKIMQGYLMKVENPKIRKFYLNYVNEIYQDLAHCYESLGAFDKSPEYYLLALTIDPGNGILYWNLGMNYIKINRFKDAAEVLENGLVLDPNNLMMMNTLAIVAKELGQFARAEELLRMLVEKDPSSLSAKENLDQLINHIKR